VITTIAHRGDPLGARENTLAAFESALVLGADWVELDLRRTRDGAIVVLHDQTLERLWGLDSDIGELDLVDVAAIGSLGIRIPTLAQVLEAVPVPLMVDFTRREVVAGALEAVHEAGAVERSLFVTGNIEALGLLRRLSEDARIGLTWTDGPVPPLAVLAELQAEYWNPMYRFVSAEAVAAVHASGRKVSTWTVDDEDDMTKVVAAGVDAVVSNRVQAFVQFARSGRGLAQPGGARR
jgi:myo-inositol-1(or 4)-monophosphatase